jgi:hypothetical protein
MKSMLVFRFSEMQTVQEDFDAGISRVEEKGV